MTEKKKDSESGLNKVQPHDSSALHGQSYNSVRGFAALVVTQFLGAGGNRLSGHSSGVRPAPQKDLSGVLRFDPGGDRHV